MTQEDRLKQDAGNIARGLVVAELQKRGMTVEVSTHGRRPVLWVTGRDGNRVAVMVRGKTAGTWQRSIDDPSVKPDHDNEFYWIFVDLGMPIPELYICPGSYVAADIARCHARYLSHHGGERAETEDSKHHAIRPHRIVGWKDAWQPLIHQANLKQDVAKGW